MQSPEPQRRLRYPPRAVFLAALVVPLFFAGCGNNEMVPISGTITLQGQAMPNEGMLYFLPENTDKKATTESGQKARPGMAKFGTDGKFSVMTQTNTGLLPGTYLVSVECWKSLPEISGPPPVSLVAKKYQSAMASGLRLVVLPNESRADVQFDVNAP